MENWTSITYNGEQINFNPLFGGFIGKVVFFNF